MRKQLRVSDILYSHVNVHVKIKHITGLGIQYYIQCKQPFWIICIKFDNDCAITKQVYRDNIFEKSLKEIVKEVNLYLKENFNGSSNKA